jgi:hypothetical protein
MFIYIADAQNLSVFTNIKLMFSYVYQIIFKIDPLINHHVKSCDHRDRSARTLAAILAGNGT